MGGAGTYASILVKGLKSRGVEVATIASGDSTFSDHDVYRLSVPNIEYWRRFFFTRATISLLNVLNKKQKFDLVHFNEPHIIVGSLDVPIVCTFHASQLNELKLSLIGRNLGTVRSITDLALKNPVGYLCDILAGRSADKIICPSSDLARLMRYSFVDEKKISVIPNGISLEEFDKIDCIDASSGKGTLEKGSFLLYIGRLDSLKGIQYLIKAFQRIRKKNNGLKLVIAGRGEFEPYLRRIASGTNGILFVGHVYSTVTKRLLYENCLAVVLPSIYETFPMVVLEAMACGKPVIATNVGGIPLLVRNGENGFLVEPKDVGALESSIRILLEDANLRRKMGISGRKLVEKNFTSDKMVSDTLKVYESLL